MLYLIFLVGLLFSTFVMLDIFSTIPRMSGAVLENNGLAYSFQVMVNTIKRVLIVSYPPFVGALALSDNLSFIGYAIAFSYFMGMLAVIVSISLRVTMASIFCGVIFNYSKVNKLLPALYAGLKSKSEWKNKVRAEIFPKLRKVSPLKLVDLRIFLPAIWIYFFYSGSVFIINVISFLYSDYSSIILQTTGFFNALGTIALAFYLDPKLSVGYEKKVDLQVIANSILAAHFFNIFIVSPLFFGGLFLVL